MVRTFFRKSANPRVRAAVLEVLETRQFFDATLTPTADTFVRDGTSAGNVYGSYALLQSKQGAAGVQRQIYEKFDLSGLSGSISHATLQIYGNRSNTNDSTFSIAAAAMSDNSWSEASTTWNNKPAVGSTINSTSVTSTTKGLINLDVTSYLQQAQSNGQTTVSIAIVGTANTDAYFEMSSREGTNSPQLMLTTGSTAPAAPTNLTAPSVQTNAVTLNWADNSNNETGFQVQRKQGTGAWATLTTTSANATSYIDTTVSAGQSYSYRVIAVNAAGSSASSNTVNASVPTASTTTFTPTADTYVRDSTFSSTTFGTSGTAAARLSTTSTNNRQIYLKFDLSSLSGSVSSATLNVYGYRSNTNDSTFAIAAAQMSDNSWTESSTDWDNKPAVGSTISTANVPNTSYQWISLDVSSYIQAAKANNQSVVSIAIVGAAATTDYFTMLTRESQNAPQLVVASSTTTNAPAAPANVVATGASSKTVHVTWNDVATNETGYQVQYRLQGGTGAYTTLNLPAGSTSADITNLTAGTAYELQVTALGSTNSAAVATTASTLAAPIITASSPKQEGASITLGVNLGSPAPSGVSYAWTLTGATLSSTTAAAPTFTPADDGSYTAAVTVIYANGDTAAATSTINVANVAPTLGISGDSSVETGQTYTLSLSHTDPGTDTIQSWAINWGDGSAVETFTGADPTPTHVFNTDGNYTISATATDEDGTFSVSGPLIVAVAAAPVGTGYQASFNFEPDGAAAVPGYITDIGDQYDLGSSGYTFGWVDPLTGQPTKNSGATFDRQAVSDRRLDSGIDSVTSDGRTLSWEAAVPNGSYYVTLVAGDAEATSGAYSFDVEGSTGFLSGAASSGSGRWITATGVVTVNDGKLTINNGTGAVNHALAYVEITNATARSKATVSAPLNVVATAAGATSVDVRWEDGSDNETQFTIERSSDGGNVWSTLGATAANAGLFTDTMASANTTYAYRVAAVNDVTGTSASSQSNTITTPLSDGQFPYNTGRTTWVTDQTIEAEDFDAGGQGVSYNDSIVGNAGGFYRSGNADVGYSLADDHYFVGWTRVGEWMEYTINVAAAGTYQLTASVACLGKGGTFEVLLNGAHTGSQLAIPDTGSFSTYQTINGSTGLTLPAGTTVLRLQAVDDSSPYYLGDMDWLELQRANTTAHIQLEATAANESETNLAWNDAVFGETGYVISQSTDGESFEPILTTPPNATGWSVKNLLPDTHYWFKVTAVTGEVDDASSNAAEAQTLPADLTPWDDLDIQFTAQHVTADIPAPSYFAAAIDSAHQYRLKYVSGADQFVADPFFTAQASLVDDAAIPNILSSAQHIDWYNSSPEVIEAEIAAAGGLFSDPVITQSHRLGARFDDPGYTDNNPSSPGVYWQLQSRSISGNVPTVSIASSIAQVTEPASLTDAPTTLRFVVARTGSVAADLPILLQPPAGTAALGSDYDGVPATVSIPAGQSSVSVDVAVNADNLTETDETVAVCIEASGLYRLGGSYSAFGTIHDVAGHAGTPVDNQAPIIVSAASVPSTAINALTTPLSVLGADDGGEANLTYTWSIYGDAPGPVTFSDNNDNTAKAVTATFTTSGTYRLQAVATDADGLSSDASVVTVVVTLAEAKPTVTIEATDSQAVEGAADDVLSFTVTRTGSTDQALVVQLASPTGTASEGEDYAALPRAITIPAGSSSVLFGTTPIADGVTEGNETVIERIAPDAAYTVGTPDTATGTIQDEDNTSGDPVLVDGAPSEFLGIEADHNIHYLSTGEDVGIDKSDGESDVQLSSIAVLPLNDSGYTYHAGFDYTATAAGGYENVTFHTGGIFALKIVYSSATGPNQTRYEIVYCNAGPGGVPKTTPVTITKKDPKRPREATLVLISEGDPSDNTRVDWFLGGARLYYSAHGGYRPIVSVADAIYEVTEYAFQHFGQYFNILVIDHGSSGSQGMGYRTNDSIGRYIEYGSGDEDVDNDISDWEATLYNAQVTDVMYLGCEVAKGEKGKEFLETLAENSACAQRAFDGPTYFYTYDLFNYGVQFLVDQGSNMWVCHPGGVPVIQTLPNFYG